MTSDSETIASKSGNRALFFWRRSGDPLVTKEMLEEYVKKATKNSGLGSKEQDYLHARWISMVMWWHNRSIEAKWKYYWLRRIVIIGGVLIPVLSALGITNHWGNCPVIAASIVGAAVAAAAAWEGIGNYGETWREKRRAAELLKVEGWLYLNLCGRYANEKSTDAAFPVFVGEVEKMIAAEVGQYLALFDASLEQTKAASNEIVAEIVAEVKKRLDARSK